MDGCDRRRVVDKTTKDSGRIINANFVGEESVVGAVSQILVSSLCCFLGALIVSAFSSQSTATGDLALQGRYNLLFSPSPPPPLIMLWFLLSCRLPNLCQAANQLIRTSLCLCKSF